MIIRGYERQDWAAHKQEMLDVFRNTYSRPDSLVNTREYWENLAAGSGGRDDTGSLKSFVRTHNQVSGVVTKRAMMLEYERIEMLQCALPKRLWRKATSKLGLHSHEPRTVKYSKLKSWIAARNLALEAMTMINILAPAVPPPWTFPALAISPPFAVSPTSKASPVPMATTASTAPTAPTSTLAFPVSSTPDTPKPHSTSSALLMSLVPMASSAPMVPLAVAGAEIPMTTPNANHNSTCARPTVRLGIVRVAPP